MNAARPASLAEGSRTLALPLLPRPSALLCDAERRRNRGGPALHGLAARGNEGHLLSSVFFQRRSAALSFKPRANLLTRGVQCSWMLAFRTTPQPLPSLVRGGAKG